MHTIKPTNSSNDSKNKGNKGKEAEKAPVKASAVPKNVFAAFGGDSDSDED